MGVSRRAGFWGWGRWLGDGGNGRWDGNAVGVPLSSESRVRPARLQDAAGRERVPVNVFPHIVLE
jgi:hypothetical protein